MNIVYAQGLIDDAPTVSEVLLNVLNFVLSIVAVVGIIVLVIAGLMYLLSGGAVRRVEFAKRMVVWAIVGIVVSLGALIILNFFISIVG